MGIENVKAWLWGKDIADTNVLAKAFEEFARPDTVGHPDSTFDRELIPEPTFRPGDFVRVIDPHSIRGGEYGEVIGLFGQG